MTQANVPDANDVAAGPNAGAGSRHRRRRRLRPVLVGLITALVAVVVSALVVAYWWKPAAQEGFRSPYLAQIVSRYADTPIARFHYTKTGHGPPVVLVPGGGQWIYSYRDTVPVLARQFTVYAVDLPGQGYTTLRQDDFRYDLDAMSAALGSFLDAVGLRRTSLVGHSWGGATSLYFAERAPERVDRLVLLASPGLDVPSSWDWRPLEIPVVGELIGKLMTKENSAATQRKSFARADRVTPDLIDENWAPMSRPANREALWLQQRRFDYALTEQRLGDVRSPTMVIWGDQDQFDEPWQAGELANRIPGGTARVLPGCGHSVHEDCPDEINLELADFLRQPLPTE
ncbi:alpha/beta hydrolase [Mycolicibacterium boenickei]